MKTIFTTLLLLFQSQVFAQTVQTTYYTNKGKIEKKLSKAAFIAKTTINEQGDVIAFESKRANGSIITAYQCEDYIPVGPWIFDGEKVEIPTHLASPHDKCEESNVELLETLLPRKDLITFLAKNIRYPEYAIASNIQGKVYLVVDFDKNGAVENVRVQKSTNPILSLEAIRVIKELKIDTRAIKDFEGIKCFEQSISFKLN